MCMCVEYVVLILPDWYNPVYQFQLLADCKSVLCLAVCCCRNGVINEWLRGINAKPQTFEILEQLYR